MDLLPLQSGWITYTGLLILSCVGCQVVPTKLTEWIGKNLQDELGFSYKADQRAEPGTGWTPAELNHVLQSHVVDGALSTFGCVEWESDLCRDNPFPKPIENDALNSGRPHRFGLV